MEVVFKADLIGINISEYGWPRLEVGDDPIEQVFDVPLDNFILQHDLFFNEQVLSVLGGQNRQYVLHHVLFNFIVAGTGFSI